MRSFTFSPRPDRHLNHVTGRRRVIRRCGWRPKATRTMSGLRLQRNRPEAPQKGNVERFNRNVRLVQRRQDKTLHESRITTMCPSSSKMCSGQVFLVG